MAVLDVLNVFVARRSRTKIEGPIEIEIDAALLITHERSSTITDNPIEEGAVVSDHVVREPERVTLEGLVTDHPVDILGGLVQATAAGGIQGAIDALGGAVGDLVGNERRSRTAFRLLLEAWSTAARLRIVTALHTYEDMVIESLIVPSEVTRGEAIEFTARLRRVQVARLGAITLPDRLLDTVTGAIDRNADMMDRGRQPSRTANATETGVATATLGAVPAP